MDSDNHFRLMIEIKLPPKPVYNTLYGIDEKYHNEVEYIKGLVISPLFQDVQNLNKYNGLLNEYTRKNKRLGRLKRLRESCKEEITHWWHYLFYALCSLLAFMGTGPLFAFVLFVFSLFGVELNLPEHFAVYLFFFPAGCVIVYFIGIVIAWIYSQITIRFLDRKINDKELRNKVLGGDVVSKKVALEILRIREDERFAKEKERFDVEVEKMEQKYPGIKATEGSCSLYSRNVFKRESEGFVKALKDLIKRCNQLYTKQWWETMTPFDFENEVAKWFVQKGYNAITTQHSADGGVDIVLEKDGVKEYVQCKHYMNQTIPVATVRELFGVMASDNIKSGYIVSLYGMTQGAAEFAYKNNIKSITLEQLSEKPDKIVYDDKVVYTGYHDTVLNQSCVGISVGDCFIYEDVFDDSKLAQESLKKRIVPEERWLFVLSTNGRYYSNGYYAVVSCPILMKDDIQKTGKVLDQQ